MNGGTLENLGETAAVVPRRAIPFDIAFRFNLTGEPNRVLRRIATISVEATYVATSIGYGVVPEDSSKTFGPRVGIGSLLSVGGVQLGSITLGNLLDGLAIALDDPQSKAGIGSSVAKVFSNGFKLNPAFAAFAIGGGGTATVSDADQLSQLFQTVAAPPERIQFRYALFDDATGREFQSEPILNIAGLGIADGARPFRYFARPIVFRPRSTIRLEITELSEFKGELHVALQGYKALGGAGTPTGRAVRSAAGRAGASRRR